MKVYHLLHAAITVPIVVGRERVKIHRLNEMNYNSSMNSNNRRRQKPIAPAIVCAADETPCHDEVGTTITCAKEGDVCPCFDNEIRCTSPHFGEYCDTVCCDWGVEQRCHAPDLDAPGQGHFKVWCANIADGGCPCPDGETKCGDMETDGGFTGYCTSLCCDDDDLQTCYDDNFDPSYCALIAEGGCPCTEGKIKCGATEDWAGYCTNVCCESDEETCQDEMGKKSCRKLSMGGCPFHTSYAYWQSQFASMILTKGTRGQISYYSDIIQRKQKLSEASENAELIQMLEGEEAALFHTIRLRNRETPTPETATSIL